MAFWMIRSSVEKPSGTFLARALRLISFVISVLVK